MFEFTTNLEELAVANICDSAVGEMCLIRDEEEVGYVSYPPRFVPENGRYLPARHRVGLTVSTEPLGTKTSVDATVSIKEFNGQIINIGFGSPVLKLFSLKTEDPVAQVELQPEYLPNGVGEKGDSCYISIRLEYDHQAMLDHYDESGIEDRRERFHDEVKEIEEEYF
ncbi:hypothetical protein [Natrinema salinisoli]|uniref:hypothetical protein n=1 Tax=Natrinema salinisoli TaxID=2878535 RepID=UPI001CEFF1D4|nr:hypothetical protein [Natrinema salinisoli]